MDHDRLRQLFDEAAPLPKDQRETFLRTACDDSDLRGEVLELLEHADQTAEYLERPAFEAYPHLARASGDEIKEFQLVEAVGRGGMGVVYRARDTKLDRDVALKLLKPSLLDSRRAIERFHQEARTSAALQHAAIVPIFQYGEDRGFYYIAMAFIEGVTLDQHLAAEDPLSPRASGLASGRGTPHVRNERLNRIARIVSIVADGLDHAHQKDVIHLDVKPSNILVDAEGEPHLTDFGIARLVSDAGIAAAGDGAGTPSYMSPEQAGGESSELDHRTDIFSLGIVLYEALAGKRPFAGSRPEAIIEAIRTAEPPPLREVVRGMPRDLATICHKALEKDPARRYQTAAHLAADLRCWRNGDPILARPPGPLRRAQRWIGHHRTAFALGAVVALAVLVTLLSLAIRDYHRSTTVGLTLSSGVTGSTVYARRYNAETLRPGPPTRVGALPLRDRRVAPGQYRFEILHDDGTFQEIEAHLLEPGMLTSIDVPRVEPDLEDMVRIPAGRYTCGRRGGDGLLAEREVELPAFWLDRYEVSNAQYRAFLDATGHPEPYGWQEFGYDEALDEYPVVGITLSDMKAFARWAGKRLPTAFELEAAARRPVGRLHPWGTDGGFDGPEVTKRHLMLRKEATWEASNEVYRDLARPVRSGGRSRSIDGIHHLFGNAAEATVTMDFESGAFVVKGGSWLDEPDHWDMASVATQPIHAWSMYTGFRCAVSEEPAARASSEAR